MSEHGFLRASEFTGWLACPGRPWLEDNFPAPDVEPLKPTEAWLNAFKARGELHQEAGAQVQIVSNGRVDISVVTGERHASATADLLIAQYAEHSILEAWKLGASEDEVTFLAFSAFLHHCLLHNFTSVVLVGREEWSRTPDDLYVFGQRVTEAAHRSLSIQGEPETSQLVPTAWCATCRANRNCPGVARKQALELV
jgi:hypothetical protein